MSAHVVHHAHKKQPPPLGPPYDPRYSPTVGSYGGVFLMSEVPPWLTVCVQEEPPCVGQEQLLRSNEKRFRGGLVFKARRLL